MLDENSNGIPNKCGHGIKGIYSTMIAWTWKKITACREVGNLIDQRWWGFEDEYFFLVYLQFFLKQLRL